MITEGMVTADECLQRYQYFQQFLNLVQTRGSQVVGQFNLDFVDEIFEKRKKTKRGRPPTYTPSQKFRALIYGWAEGKHDASEIARGINNIIAMKACKLHKGAPSHDTLTRFWNVLPEVVEEIFERLAQQAIDMGITDCRELVTDTTSIETKFQSDKDARWNFDATADDFYFGYGLMASVCPNTHLPVRATFTDGKHVNKEQAMEMADKIEELHPEVLIADSEFDIIDFHKRLLERGTLPIIRYNPRNTANPPDIKYRVQLTLDIPQNTLDDDYGKRPEVEHTFSTLKERFGLEDIHVRGTSKVKVHVFLSLICRIAYAIACYKRYPNESVRKTISLI